MQIPTNPESWTAEISWQLNRLTEKARSQGCPIESLSEAADNWADEILLTLQGK